jgi:predicted metal-dependent phosphoesterase TrpH
LLRADFHIHTQYSMDCQMSIEKIIERCKATGLNCVSICDHGSAEGGLRMQEAAPFKVIISEEILTPAGEIMGMFLKETIPSNISVEEAIFRIKSQDGLVCLPHMYDPFRGLKMEPAALEKLAQFIDVIEIFNARCAIQQPNVKAQEFARAHNLPGTLGSDSHTPAEIGRSYIEIPEFSGKDDFKKALLQGKMTTHKTSIFVHVGSTLAKVGKLFGK